MIIHLALVAPSAVESAEIAVWIRRSALLAFDGTLLDPRPAAPYAFDLELLVR
jgi:hypothetical protein